MRCGCLTKDKSRRECCCTAVPKDPEQQANGPFVAARWSWGPELSGQSQEVITKGRKATTMNMNTTLQPDVALPDTPIGAGGRVARFGCL